MLEPPFSVQTTLAPEDYQKIGELAIRWSHIEHIAGNCLKTMLRLSDEEAAVVVFPLMMDQRLQRIKKLAEFSHIKSHILETIAELSQFMSGIQYVRSNLIHAVFVDHPQEGHLFYLVSKRRILSKAEIFSIEEITNYAAHLALWLRYALGVPGSPIGTFPLPDRPDIPEFLRKLIPTRRKGGQPQPPPPRSSPE